MNQYKLTRPKLVKHIIGDVSEHPLRSNTFRLWVISFNGSLHIGYGDKEITHIIPIKLLNKIKQGYHVIISFNCSTGPKTQYTLISPEQVIKNNGFPSLLE